MGNMVQRAMAAGELRLRSVAGEEVTYVRRDGGEQISLVARKAFVRDELIGRHNVPVRVERWRFTFEAADLVAGAQAVKPEEGDELVAIVGTKQVTYRVSAADEDEPCWGWNDSAERELFVDTVPYGEE